MSENVSAAANIDKSIGFRLRTILILIALQLPLAGMLIPGSGIAAQAGREAFFWACTAFLVAYILTVERRALSSIGLRRPTWKSLVFGLAGAVVMIAGMAFIYLVIFPAFGLSDASQTD